MESTCPAGASVISEAQRETFDRLDASSRDQQRSNGFLIAMLDALRSPPGSGVPA